MVITMAGGTPPRLGQVLAISSPLDDFKSCADWIVVRRVPLIVQPVGRLDWARRLWWRLTFR